MSYGNQLNIFRAQATRYGSDWKGLICCPTVETAKAAAEDAEDALGGYCSASARTLSLPNGATLIFRVVTCRMEAQTVFSGRDFTQIAWLKRPTGDHAEYLIYMARAHLRSRNVPACDWRHEYCMAR